MPASARPGLLILALGLIADLLYHGLSLSHVAIGDGAHLTMFVGMALVTVSVTLQGIRKPGTPSPQGDVNAIR